jgi:hypothetical protein
MEGWLVVVPSAKASARSSTGKPLRNARKGGRPWNGVIAEAAACVALGAVRLCEPLPALHPPELSHDCRRVQCEGDAEDNKRPHRRCSSALRGSASLRRRPDLPMSLGTHTGYGLPSVVGLAGSHQALNETGL